MEAEVVIDGIFFLSAVIFAIAVNDGLNAIGRGLKEIASAIERASKNK